MKYIKSKPPILNTKILTKFRVLGFHPINVYTNRLLQFENYSFIDYFTKYETNCFHIPNLLSYREDNLSYYIYEYNKVTRFTHFHSTHSSEGFFNILLHTICFSNENTLLLLHNKQQNYVHECYSQGIILDLESL